MTTMTAKPRAGTAGATPAGSRRRQPRPAASRGPAARERAQRRSRAVTSPCHPRGMIARAGAAVTLALAALAAGCGSAPPDELPPAAEPASSPPATQAPAGRVVPVGNRPEGIAADAATGRFAVGLREPDELALLDGATGKVVERIPLPAAPRHLQSADGEALVPAEDADALVRVRFADGAAERARTGREPHDAAASGGRVFVADEFANRLTVLDGDRPAAPIPPRSSPVASHRSTAAGSPSSPSVSASSRSSTPRRASTSTARPPASGPRTPSPTSTGCSSPTPPAGRSSSTGSGPSSRSRAASTCPAPPTGWRSTTSGIACSSRRPRATSSPS